ncbi:MAG: PEP/pyruvate-binding domain-containing protein, partial [Cyanobacteria bacterium P01_F01_bin.42]
LNGQHAKNSAMFHFLKGTPPQQSLDQRLHSGDVGSKAANLALLKRYGYTVPSGWVLKAGDDPELFAAKFEPTSETPLVARSSAVGEDTLDASAAGQYETVLNITSQPSLLAAIARCQDSFENPSAVHYRQVNNIHESTMAVLVQPQVASVYSGVVFSRDPVESWLDQVVVEGVVGHASQLVSGQTTPERFVVSFAQAGRDNPSEQDIRGQGQDIPRSLILEVACLARRLEATFQGVPQDIEWTFDGQQVWILQSRPITTLTPTWTRKIAAEVIPGLIHPLTWSINRPLTCGVWGKLFKVVLGHKNSRDLDFLRTADLHFGRAYFNASLLGQIFLRMGLPPESLEFLTQGAPMSPPRGLAVLKSLPGLLRLTQRELSLTRQFRKQRSSFQNLLAELASIDSEALNEFDLEKRIESILIGLEKITYFQIMAPLSFALRQKLLQVDPEDIDSSALPEIAATKAIAALADKIPESTEAVLPYLQTELVADWERFMEEFGYLSEVATDISVPTWREQPGLVAQSVQLLRQPKASSAAAAKKTPRGWLRLRLKGEVAEIYNRLLADLRWSFLGLEKRWIEQGWLRAAGDIFFLEWSEIQTALTLDSSTKPELYAKVTHRRGIFQSLAALEDVPPVIYGTAPERMPSPQSSEDAAHVSVMEGIGASAGQVEGAIALINSLQDIPAHIDPGMILVVPFTDAGWAPLFANAGGIISEVGGRLSHGAILAREYGIPAVMDVKSARRRLQNGQKVRIDGISGRVEILSSPGG